MIFTIDDESLDSTNQSIKKFIDEIYPNLSEKLTTLSTDNWITWISERAILAPKNTDVDLINAFVSEKLPGKDIVYSSADTTDEENDETRFPTEYLNSLTPSGMPPYQLHIKVMTCIF